MRKRQITISVVLILALLSITILAACGTSSSTSTPVGTSTALKIDVQALMDQQCARCHPLSRVTSKTKTAAQWKITLDRMVRHGARLSSDQERALIDYLAQNY